MLIMFLVVMGVFSFLDLGVDLFLLDDGWFANKYPRNNDSAGLGDWQETALLAGSGQQENPQEPFGLNVDAEEAERSGLVATTTVWVATTFSGCAMLFSFSSAWRLSQPCATNTASNPNAADAPIIPTVLVRT